MPRQSKGPRLWLRKRAGRPATWIIRDGERQQGTECAARELGRAEKALQAYIAKKHLVGTTRGARHPSAIPVADVMNLYIRDKAPGHARPHETAMRVDALMTFFGNDTLADISGRRCRAYVAFRSTDAAARRELEDLRAGINHHRGEGLCSEIVAVVLPDRRPPRERWLTRDEAARLIRAAWREPKRQHVARFILVALYTGTRAGAICGAALKPTAGRGWIDAERGVFYRRPAGKRESKKRQPPIPLHGRLLAHIRRWIRRRVAIENVVEFEGAAVLSVRKSFAGAVTDARLEGKVTPHVLRHTSATWLMQGGADLLEAARLLGMTPQMLLDTYGHHHPAHLQGALKAFDKGKSGRHRLNETKSEQASSNVCKLADKY